MRLFALIALALVCAAVPANAQARAMGQNYITAPNATPGEPPTAVLVMTGVAGIAFVGLKKRAPQK